MASKYPAALDSLSTGNANATKSKDTHPALHNDANDAINKIEAELGTNPSGSDATVKERFETNETAIALGLGELPSSVVRGSNEPVTGPGFPHVYNVKDGKFGAKGDGTTDDSVAIHAATRAAKEAGGGIVFLPGSTYLVGVVQHPRELAGYYAGVWVPSGVTLVGAGSGATTIKLKASVTEHGATSVVANENPDKEAEADRDARCKYVGFTIDGNGSNQTFTYQGLNNAHVEKPLVEDVVVKNIRGTASSGANETFAFVDTGCEGARYIACEAIGEGKESNTSSGFSSNSSTDTTRIACRAKGMGKANGFTEYEGSNIRNIGCASKENQGTGFNFEKTTGTNSDCSASGNENGVTVNVESEVGLVNQVSQENGNGAFIKESSRCRTEGGTFTGNSNRDILFNDTASAKISLVARTTRVTNFEVTGGAGAWSTTTLTAPTLPEINVDTTNTFPFDVSLYIAIGTEPQIKLEGGTVNLGNKISTVKLAPGQTIRYGQKPSQWIWSRA